MLAFALALQLAASPVGPPPALPPLRLGQLTAAELAAPPPSAGLHLGAFVLAGALAAAADAALVGLSFAMLEHGSVGSVTALGTVLFAALVAGPPFAAAWGAVRVLGPTGGRAFVAATLAHAAAMLVAILVIVDRQLDPGPGLAAFCAIDLVLTGGAAVLFHRPATGTAEWPPQASGPAARALPPPRRGGAI